MAQQRQRPSEARALTFTVQHPNVIGVVKTPPMSVRRVKVCVERIRENKTTAREGALAMKKRDILNVYPEDKAEKLCKKLFAQGRYYEDEEFPGDNDEIFYYVRQPRKVNVDAVTSEKASLSANMKVGDASVMEQMTGSDGVFAAGAMPAMKAASAAGAKAVADMVAGDGTQKGQKPRKTPKAANEAEIVLPTTPKDRAEEVANDVLKAVGEAKKLCLSLKGMEYSDDLHKDLGAFAGDAESMYLDINKLLKKTKQKKKYAAKYEDFVATSTKKLEWYKKAEASKLRNRSRSQKSLRVSTSPWKLSQAAGKSFLSAAKKKKQPKAKAKHGKDKEQKGSAKAAA